MSGRKGPLPRYIYVRRRLLLLAIVIALVWLVVQVIGRVHGSDSSTHGSAASSATPTPASASPTAPSGAGGVGAVPVTLTAAGRACHPEDVDMLAWVPSGQTAGKPVSINLVFSTTTKGGCTLTSAAAQLVVVISSGGTPVYDSDVCKASLLTAPVALAQGWSTQATVTWTGRGSGRSCSAKEAYASPGQYVLQIGTLGGNPAKATFDLARGATPTPTATPSPSASTSTASPTPSSAGPTRHPATPSPTASRKTD